MTVMRPSGLNMAQSFITPRSRMKQAPKKVIMKMGSMV